MAVYPDACFLTSAHRAEQFIPDTGREVAFAGRSNSGKSSAINAIVGRRGFARTSKSPGRTQLVNFFSLAENCRLVDLPGYGYARVARTLRDHWRGLLQEYFEHRQSLAGLMLVVDCRRLLRDFDWQMLEWGQAIGCPVHVLLTKADKLKRQAASQSLATVRRELGDAGTVQLFSALKSDGLEEARNALDEFLRGQVAGRAPPDDVQKKASDEPSKGASEAKTTGMG